MKTSFFSLAAIMFTASSFSQGLKFDPSDTERFVDGKEPKVGLTMVDRAQKITWMRCAVEQEFDVSTKECSGRPAALTYTQASAFAEKIGEGWRLPTYSELSSNGELLMRILAQGKRVQPGKYGGGGWACHGMPLWSSTKYQSSAGNIGLVGSCKETTSGTFLEEGLAHRYQEPHGAYLILVRSN